MNKKLWILLTLVLVAVAVVVACWLWLGWGQNADIDAFTPTTPTGSKDDLTFTGRVKEVYDGSILMECYDTTKFTTVCVHLGEVDVSPAVGEEYTVTHTGVVMESFPPQIQAVKVMLVSSTPTSSTTTEPVSTATLSFKGKVLEVDDDSVLMDCYDKDKFDTVWVYFGALDVVPTMGEEYTITYEDMMMPSLPPRIAAVSVTAISSQAKSYLTEAEVMAIAEKHWNVRSGDRDPDTGFMMSIGIAEKPTEDNPHFAVILRWYVEDEEGQIMNASLLDTIYIHAVTGAIALPGENTSD